MKNLINTNLILAIFIIFFSNNSFGDDIKNITIQFSKENCSFIEKVNVDFPEEVNSEIHKKDRVLKIKKTKHTIVIETNSNSLKINIDESHNYYILNNISNYNSKKIKIQGFSFYSFCNDKLINIANLKCKNYCTYDILLDNEINYKCDSCGFAEIEQHLRKRNLLFENLINVNDDFLYIKPIILFEIDIVTFKTDADSDYNKLFYSICYILDLKNLK
jgi:hypothetical protein